MPHSQFYFSLHREPPVVYAKVPWSPEFAGHFAVDAPLAVLAATNWRLLPKDLDRALRWADLHRDQYKHHYIEFLLDQPDEADRFRRDSP